MRQPFSLSPTASCSRLGGSVAMSDAVGRRALLLSSLALCGTLPGAAYGEGELAAELPAAELPPPPPPPPPPAPRQISVFDFDVPFKGEPVDIKPFIGKATIFVNVKFDDPETVKQLPELQDLQARYSSAGLHVLAFPTDQGWFEADDSNSLRIKFKQTYDFGKYPSAMVRRPRQN